MHENEKKEADTKKVYEWAQTPEKVHKK